MKKIKDNKFLMLGLCCGTLLILLLAAIYFFGLNQAYLLWFMVLLCPLIHYLMMKDAHKDSRNKNKKRKKRMPLIKCILHEMRRELLWPLKQAKNRNI